MPKTSHRKLRRPSARNVTLAERPRTGGYLIPPSRGVPTAPFPISVDPNHRALAPIPINDRFPTVIGQQLSITYISNVFRLATTGYRQQLADLLNELLENDPHLYSVVQKRVLSTANGRLEIVPYDLPETHPDYEKAQEIADFIQAEFTRIPDICQTIAALMWAVYYGISCAEIFWTRDGDGWHVERFGFVHNRRLSYPDYQSWDLHIWDQGQVYGWNSPWGSSPTNSNQFGLRIASFPGKFLVYTPQLRGDYPTRDGIGRQVAVWAAFKKIGARGAVDYLERFAKPMMDVSYSTQPDGNPREAQEEDIATAAQIAASIGPGSGSYAAHPDSVMVEPKMADGSAGRKLTWPEWIAICNAEMSKAALGGTLSTEVGTTGGNRALGEVQERGEVDIEQYDATTVGEAIRRDVVTWMVRLNRPDCMHILPHVLLHVDPDPAPKALLAAAKDFTSIGAPIDLDALSDQVGLALVPNESDKPRRSYMAFTADPFQVDPALMSDEAKAQEKEQADRDHELAKAKAMQPVVAGPGGKLGKGAKPGVPGKQAKPTPVGGKTAKLKDDAGVVADVKEQLAEDFPETATAWVDEAEWEGPVPVPLSSIDYAKSGSWRASREPERVGAFEQKIQDDEGVKPVVLVKTPGKQKLSVLDGHHRALAYQRTGSERAIAYVATVNKDEGPWDRMHSQQLQRSSG